MNGARNVFRHSAVGVGFGLMTIVFAVFIAILFGSREPRVYGRRLAEWVDQYGTNKWTTGNAAAVKEAELAILSVRESAEPIFLEWLGTSDLFVKPWLRNRVPARWHARLHLLDAGQSRRRLGAYGLAALGTNAADAVPEIIDIARHHPEEDGRYIAVFTLRNLGAAAEPAVPFLIECLTNSFWQIRDDAALGLGYLGLQPDIAIPALMTHLPTAAKEASRFELRDTIQSLGLFGTNAVIASPLLETFLEHSDESVREVTTNALRMINPLASRSLGPVPQP